MNYTQYSTSTTSISRELLINCGTLENNASERVQIIVASAEMENVRSVTPIRSRHSSHKEVTCVSNQKNCDSNASCDSRYLVSPVGSSISPDISKNKENEDITRFCSCCDLLKREKEESNKQSMQQLISIRRVMADLKVGHDKEVKELRREIELLKSEVNTLQQNDPIRNEGEGSHTFVPSEELSQKMDDQIQEQTIRIKALEESLAKVTDSEACLRLELQTTKDSLEKSQEQILALEKLKQTQEESIIAKLKESNADFGGQGGVLSDLSEARQQLTILQAALIKANDESKIIEERSANEILLLNEQREADQKRVEELLAKIEAEVSVLKEQHETDQKQIDEFLKINKKLEADLKKLKDEIQFKDDAIENAENILAYLEESKEDIQAKGKSELAEKQQHIHELLLIQDEMKREIELQRNFYEDKLKLSQYAIENLLKEQQEINLLELLNSKREQSHQQGKTIFDSASNIADFLFNCASLENITDDNTLLKKKRTS